MRASPVFTLLAAVALLAIGLAVLPFDGLGGDERAPSRTPPARPIAMDTGWIEPFAANLTAPEVQQAPRVETNPLAGWQLVGLVQGDGGGWATVARGGAVRTLGLGDVLNGFELVAIENSAAVFRRGPEERSLRLPR